MAFLNGPSELQKSVSERRLSVINVGNYGEVPNHFGWVLVQIYDIFFAVLTRVRTEWLAQYKMATIRTTIKWVASQQSKKPAKFGGSS